MTEFNDWREDEQLMAGEAKVLAVRVAGLVERILLRRVLWLNPLGRHSTRVSYVVPMLSEDGLKLINRNIVTGWKCEHCQATLFGSSIEDLRHQPCCGEYA